MRTLRLLLWLRWKLFLRSSSRGGMIAGLVMNVVLLMAFAPVWLLGAFAAYVGVGRYGADVIPVAFGVAQLMWVSLGILSGALGRTFDLGSLLRYPVRPRLVFGINVVASMLAPAPLMALPTLFAVTLATAHRAGPFAALAVATGAVLLMLVTASLLQVLLALLDEALRHERVRYVATALMTLMFVGVQFLVRVSMRELSQNVAMRLLHHEITPEQALALAARVFAGVPTVSAPAALATGAFTGAWGTLVLGLAGSLALLVLGVWPGAALMRRTVRGGESAGGGRVKADRRESRGSFALGAPFLGPGVALLVARELRMTLRHPQRLMSVVMAPLVGIVFLVTSAGNAKIGAGAALALLASSVGTSSLLLFGYDGAGVRSFFLLPCAPRDVLLAKHLELLARFAVQVVLAFVALVIVTHHGWTTFDVAVLLDAIAIVFLTLAAGSAVAIRHPSPARQRGLAMRGSSGWPSMAVSIGMFVAGGVLVGIQLLARRVLPVAAHDPFALAVGAGAVALGVAVWWRSLDLNARLLVACREKIVDVIGRIAHDAT